MRPQLMCLAARKCPMHAMKVSCRKGRQNRWPLEAGRHLMPYAAEAMVMPPAHIADDIFRRDFFY